MDKSSFTSNSRRRPLRRLVMLMALWLALHSAAEVYLAREVAPALGIRRRTEVFDRLCLEQPPDLVYLGNSVVSVGIQPAVVSEAIARTGGGTHNGFNLGVGAVKMGVLYQVFKNEVLPRTTPKLLIIGFIGDDLTDTALGTGADSWHVAAEFMETEDLATLAAVSHPSMEESLSLGLRKGSRLYRYKYLIRSRLLDTYHDLLEPARVSADGVAAVDAAPLRANDWLLKEVDLRETLGWEPVEAFVRPEVLEKARTTTRDYTGELAMIDPDPAIDSSYLPHILRLAKERGITPVFVPMPRPAKWRAQARASDKWGRYIEKVRKYVEAAGGRWVEIEVESWLTDDQLPDRLHLSEAAAARFSRLLGEQLAPIIDGS